MIFVWFFSVIRAIVWLFRIPKPEERARANKYERCPICGAKAHIFERLRNVFRESTGRLRCVYQGKHGPRAQDAPVAMGIYRQHRCKECGAKWHHVPLVPSMTISDILPAAPRNDLEAKEDRNARLYGLAKETEATKS